ncbi:helix-turn-helix domain-containing protein [Actinoplanes sp. NPDC051470]|uniref:IclR family transcriptional regulator n=1 Tax=unclassified Actinoplanes TaxID=2626549 RepID=UPI0034369CC5
MSDEAPQSQTLDRGIRILEHLAAANDARTATAIAHGLGMHRSITYRLLRTLEDHRLVERDPAGRYGLGLGLAALARGVRTDLQSAVTPHLAALAAELGMTAFLVVRAGAEAVTVTSVEPQDTQAHVVYRPGIRHPVDRGAPGLALLMADPPGETDRPELVEARRAGFATSLGEVIAGLRSVAAPLAVAGAALAVVYVESEFSPERIGRAVVAAAGKIIE